MNFSAQIPFVEHLGFELLRMEGGEAEIAMQPRTEHLNSFGVAHGGVLMTLLDVVMAQAARAPAHAGGTPSAGVVTVEMKTSFMRPGTGRLLALGRVLHRTATLVFTEATVRDPEGQLLSHASGTFKVVRALPAGEGGRHIHQPVKSD